MERERESDRKYLIKFGHILRIYVVHPDWFMYLGWGGVCPTNIYRTAVLAKMALFSLDHRK